MRKESIISGMGRSKNLISVSFLMDEAKFPHCDELVLHGKSECVYCDMHPKEQQKRIDRNVNFTGHEDANKAPCPSTLRRPLSNINKWQGNRAVTEEGLIARDNEVREFINDMMNEITVIDVLKS